jgi:Kef-type K+ transport system membrane component KefB
METRDAVSLVVLYLGAFLAPLAAGRLNIPAAVAEILFGLFLGKSGLHLVHPTTFTQFLSQLGFLFLMFLVGMEIDFNRIKKEGRLGLLLSALIAVCILCLGVTLASIVGWPPFLGLVLGAMSVGILLVSMAERGIQKSRFGQAILVVGSIGEFLTLLCLTGYNLTSRFGVGRALFLPVLKALCLFIAAYFLLSLLRLLVWWAPHRFQRLVDAADPSEIGVRAGFVLMLILAALAALVRLEAILGAFLAGALFSFVFREKGVLDTKLAAIGQGFFVPIFFISVGLSFDAGALPPIQTLLSTVLALGAASLLTKMVPSLLLLFLRLPARQVLAGGFLLSSPLTLLVAIATVGRDLKILEPGMSSAIILLAIITGVLFPICFRLILGPRVVSPSPS